MKVKTRLEDLKSIEPLNAEPFTIPDLRMCRKWNRLTNRKEFCLAKFYGDNLSGAVTFFGVDRPLPSQIEAAKTYYLTYLQERDDAGEDQQVTEWTSEGFDTWRDQGQVNKHGEGQEAGAASECDRTRICANQGSEAIIHGRR